MRRATDVFIVGGGPAGLAAAIAARKRGFEVTVADGGSPPIDKACGEGLFPLGLGALRDLGVELSASEGYPLRGVRFHHRSAAAGSRLLKSSGLGLRRVVLHQRMIECAEACGVRLLWKAAVSGVSPAGVRIGKTTVSARWIVGADGSSSRVRRWAGLDRPHRHDHRFGFRRHYRIPPWSDNLELYWGRNFQFYVTPVSEDEVCVAMLSRSPEKQFNSGLAEFPTLAARLANAEQSTLQRGAVTFMRRLPRVTHTNVALVGDASGSVDAITGDGLRLAFLQAQALADALADGNLAAYEAAHRQIVRRARWMARLLLSLDGRERLQRRIIRGLAAQPQSFSRLIAVHTGAAPVGTLLRAGVSMAFGLLTA